MDWLGRAKLDFHSASKSLPIKEKNGSSTTLLDICKESIPACQLNPLLFNGDLQTCYTAVQRLAPDVHYKRKIFQASHPGYTGSFAVDFVTEDSAETKDDLLPPRTVYFSEDEEEKLGSDDDRPMLLVLHGLSGGSHEVYLRCAINPLLESGKWEACVVNSRGCANSKITSGILYNARATWDVRQAVQWLREKYPNRPLFGLGFSLGACILTNYIAEEGDRCQLKAAIACANPWNLEASSRALVRTFVGYNLYSKVLGTAMKTLCAKHENEIRTLTNLDYDKIQKIDHLFEFDRVVQCASWGYPTEGAYYRDASSIDSVLAVRIPFLALNSTDDPISSIEALPFQEVKQNPFTIMCTTSLGGHLGWYEIGGGRWHRHPISNFFNHLAFQSDLDSIKNEMPPTIQSKGSEFDPMRRKMSVPIK